MTTPGIYPDNDTADATGAVQACPFCALACDDLSLPAHNVTDTLTCAKAREGFASALAHTAAKPTIAGQPCSWNDALDEARRLLERAQLPVFHGLVGDLADARSAWSLAARFGGVVDHRDGDALARSLAIYQDSGWISTSLGEARNRADLLVWVGDPADDRLPRLREQLIDVAERLHVDQPPRVVALGNKPRDLLDQTRALLLGRTPPKLDQAAKSLLTQLREARYAVLAVGELHEAEAEMALRSASELVRELNETQRAALLLIGRGPGDITTQLCGAWYTGFGIRTSLARGYPEQDLHRFSAQRLLDDGEADLLVWLSSLDATAPPATAQAQIVFGHPAMDFGDAAPAVFLPIAVPGVHRTGFIHRGDGLRLVPLRQMVACDLPGSDGLCAKLLGSDDQGVHSQC
jgi:formylmethanofuran dehydrogenase subunit B